MHHILSVGVDPSLLYTRGLVLERCGAVVDSATPDEALVLLCHSKYHVVVLCHSMRDRDLYELCAASRACATATKVLLVDSPAADQRRVFDVDRRFALEDGPELLVTAVQDLLAGEEAGAPGGRLGPCLIARDAVVRKLSSYAVPARQERAGALAEGDS